LQFSSFLKTLNQLYLDWLDSSQNYEKNYERKTLALFCKSETE